MTSINIKLVAATMIAAVAAFAVPVAQAGFQGPPDALDRYNAAHAVTFDGPPDAIDRYNATHAVPFNGPPDAIDRYEGRTGSVVPANSNATASSTGLDWGDFGIGAAAMLGLVLLVAGLSLGALSLRHRSGTLRTS